MASFIARFEELARSQPRATAFVDASTRLSYGEIWQAALAAAAALHRAGVRAGDTAALQAAEGESALRWLALLYGLGYLGASVLPLHFESAPASRASLARRFGAKWAACTSADPLADAARIDPASIDLLGAPATAALRGDAEERPFLYVFTSGTTGEAKACLLRFGQMTGHRLQYASVIGTTTGDCLGGPLPWQTKAGLRSLLRMHAAGGAFCNQAFPGSRRELASQMAGFGLSQLMCSPWQLRRLLASEPWPEPPRKPLRALQVGGADVTAAEIEAARREITPNVYAVYAATELGVLAHLPPGELPLRAGHVGRLPPAIEAQAVDDQHRPLGAGRLGLLRFRSATMPAEYAADPAESARRFRDGWFYPGDLGSLDAAGNLFLRGRVRDVINYGGVKISPALIEAALLGHADIADVAVVGIPHAMAGEVPVAFAVYRRAPDHDSVRRFCAEHIDINQLPFQIVEVSAVPRDAQGKIRREALRELYLRRPAG